jgi:hypothetical protein
METSRSSLFGSDVIHFETKEQQELFVSGWNSLSSLVGWDLTHCRNFVDVFDLHLSNAFFLKYACLGESLISASILLSTAMDQTTRVGDMQNMLSRFGSGEWLSRVLDWLVNVEDLVVKTQQKQSFSTKNRANIVQALIAIISMNRSMSEAHVFIQTHIRRIGTIETENWPEPKTENKQEQERPYEKVAKKEEFNSKTIVTKEGPRPKRKMIVLNTTGFNQENPEPVKVTLIKERFLSQPKEEARVSSLFELAVKKEEEFLNTQLDISRIEEAELEEAKALSELGQAERESVLEDVPRPMSIRSVYTVEEKIGNLKMVEDYLDVIPPFRWGGKMSYRQHLEEVHQEMKAKFISFGLPEEDLWEFLESKAEIFLWDVYKMVGRRVWTYRQYIHELMEEDKLPFLVPVATAWVTVENWDHKEYPNESNFWINVNDLQIKEGSWSS